MTASVQGQAVSLSYLDQIQQDTQVHVILRREGCVAFVLRGSRAPGQEVQTRGSSRREGQIWKLTAEQDDNSQTCLVWASVSALCVTTPLSSPSP